MEHGIRMVVRPVLALRGAAYRLLTPLDAAWGRLQRRREVPPLWLRRHVGAARAARFLATAEAAGRQLDELLGAGFAPRSVLDVGCGCGSMVPYFATRLAPGGRYLGVDLHRGSIAWCRRRFADDGRFAFGILPAAAAEATARRYDLVLAKSLFTHLVADDAANLLAAIRRVLAPGGRLVATAFLFEPGTPVPALRHPVAGGRVRYRRRLRPAAAVGFARELFGDLAARAGLELVEARHWFWPGDRPRLSAQDYLVLRVAGDEAEAGVPPPSSPPAGAREGAGGSPPAAPPRPAAAR